MVDLVGSSVERESGHDGATIANCQCCRLLRRVLCIQPFGTGIAVLHGRQIEGLFPEIVWTAANTHLEPITRKTTLVHHQDAVSAIAARGSTRDGPILRRKLVQSLLLCGDGQLLKAITQMVTESPCQFVQLSEGHRLDVSHRWSRGPDR